MRVQFGLTIGQRSRLESVHRRVLQQIFGPLDYELQRALHVIESILVRIDYLTRLFIAFVTLQIALIICCLVHERPSAITSRLRNLINLLFVLHVNLQPLF